MGRTFLSVKLAALFGFLVAVVVVAHPSVELELVPAGRAEAYNSDASAAGTSALQTVCVTVKPVCASSSASESTEKPCLYGNPSMLL